MQTLAEIRSLLEAHGLTPKKSLGQNFLIDQNLISNLVRASAVAPGDLVLEIGPGTGTLTEELPGNGGGDAIAGHVGQFLIHELSRVSASIADQTIIEPLLGDPLELPE